MQFFVTTLEGTGKKGWASAHVELSDSSDPAAYGEVEAISLEAFSQTYSGLDLRKLVVLAGNYLLTFCNVGHAVGKKFGVDCYVGRLPEDCGDIVFTIKEHPIRDGVAQRDDRIQALRRLKAPFHSGHLEDSLPFSYSHGVVEVHISYEGSSLGITLDMPRDNTVTYREMSIFFVYAKP